MTKPRLSLCMIVKNEERWIAQCLESVRDLVDEMVVVDTGSSDRTIEIAQGYGAFVHPHPWEDDFSKARNASLEKARGEWALVLDADEVLGSNDKAGIRRILSRESPHPLQYLIQTTYCDDSATFGWIPNNLKDPEAKGYPGFIESPLARLFRLTEEIRFRGVVHEHAVHRDPKILPAPTSIRIHHYGKYASREVDFKKQDLYLRLGEEKCRLEPDNAHAWYELGVQYWSLKRSKEAVRTLERSLELDPRSVRAMTALSAVASAEKNPRRAIGYYARAIESNPKYILPYLYLPPLLIEIGDFSFADEILRMGENVVSNHPTFHVNKGVVRQAQNRFEEALASFDEALRLNPRESLAHLNRGITCLSLKRFDEAWNSFSEAARSPQTRIAALKKMAEWNFNQRRLDEALHYLETAAREAPDDPEICYQKSVTLIQLGKIPEARQVLTSIRNPELLDSRAKTNLIKCHLAVGNVKEAESLAGSRSIQEPTVEMNKGDPHEHTL